MTSQTKSPLVSAAALHAMLGSPDVRVVDCRYELGKQAWGRGAYEAGHIPGAVFASMDHDLAGPRQPHKGRHPLPSSAAFATTLGRWGITQTSQIVTYDQGNGACAARLWWMLRACGYPNVQVLNGGYASWLAADLPTTTDEPTSRPTHMPVREFAGVVHSDELVTALAARSITLVDARGADRFAGQNEVIDPIAGHVPGAHNHPFTGNLDATQRLLDADELRARWAPLLQSARTAPIVAMCGSGITACHNLLALELAGYRHARLYAGSFSEWITDPARPVET